MLGVETLLVLEAAAIGCAAYMASLLLAQRWSPRVSARYRELSAQERLEWDGRLPSTLHAIAITAATAYLFLSPVFAEDRAGKRPFVLRTSPLSDTALGFSLGYFATDLLLLALFYPAFGGPEMAVHHLAALASVAAAAFQGQAHAYTLALLATECTTPFVNLRYLLDKGGWRHHPLYTLNGMALLVSWIVGRIVLFLFFFHHVVNHLHEFPLITPLSRWLIYLVPPTLFVLNVFWFTKILKGALKLVFGTPSKGPGPEKVASLVEEVAAAASAGSAVKKES